MSESNQPKKDNLTLWLTIAFIVFTACNWLLWGTPFPFLRIRAIQSTELPPCASNVWVQEEGKAPVCQPANIDEPGAVTFYATYPFGTDQEYANPLAAAQAAHAKLGNRSIKVYCDDLAWDSTLDTFIAELGKETIFGVPKDNFCQNGGYIEAWPIE